MQQIYDILVIGGGPGGYVSAIKAAQLGAKVALIEKHKVGGICLNYGCIPTKAFLKSAKVWDLCKNASKFGLNNIEHISFDWKSVLKRKDKIVKTLTNGIASLLKKNKLIDFYFGSAEVLNAYQVVVNDQVLQTKKLIIATGSHAFIPPIPGAKESYLDKYLYTSKELVQLETFPKKIIIIGGGIIGVEFATIFNKFGSEVIILEKQKSIITTMDNDIISAYTKNLQNSNVQVITEANVIKIDKNTVYYEYQQKVYQDKTDIILMAVGTKPNLIGLEKLNLTMDRNGILTDNFLQTSIPDVYAIGDVNGKYMLAHVASHEGVIAIHHALNLKDKIQPINYEHVPSCIYSFPEIASIGCTEKQAKERDLNYKISKIPVQAIGKAHADGDLEGFSKLIVDKNTLQILGMHIYAYNATELITETGALMAFNGTAYNAMEIIHPHPTLSELNLETFLGAIDKPIHL
ncbi:MAG: dihydrolipoyl dehydrogenase [Pigeon pea little leaf phytoplasma]|uniref:Dihydrolipoyl dehydrogenase n=1 Tax=Candidatus Phytoplasma fabacearum TaxID=2982628 RepID=A0ABU8ZSZ8_9MOLU|nr:dihydrolipoyl dehydrogenase ['Bituminaria bituminosa' little leaf phytoplasma]MDV3154030.1 dihydrolipoyl dehydrogenase [Pigeon pea little leaf phytoplasma]MDO7983606.1 dihydrolipoyl dehydrogenase ['Bituminaria bituminosa' little leaf phytoplasma]MDO8023935.1 dihydrolipoyl dehydrogenase ['Bituminaria bituminosa' little leaf phytoplasma]MDO8030517.1 dihydrolipoyl dehydrogenase ['Bituminaria bituminosa' little leaf phytoplasma]MDV3158136.1 dihydrolipoyl dehydrogenase [Pigeon pea little leaf ph